MKIYDMGDKRELFVDKFLIEEMNGTELQLHHPVYANKAIQFDDPWDGIGSLVVSVLKDDNLYRMYYRGKPQTGKDGDYEFTCYAESNDGITFSKSKLGRVTFNGSSENNILFDKAPFCHNFTAFIDNRTDISDNQRYKAIAGLHPKGLFGFVSGDGLNWEKVSEEPLITSEEFAFDSQNVAFWSESENCYICYFRTWSLDPENGSEPKKRRWISRAVSDDFINWSEPEEMTPFITGIEMYFNGTNPYFRAPHIYIAPAARWWGGKKAITDEKANEIGVHPVYAGDCSDSVLMTSRGGNLYDRTFRKSFIRPGIGYENWVSRTNYPSPSIVNTGKNEISLYVGRNYMQPTNYLGRYVLRTDGFVSVNAPFGGGEFLTKPLTFKGNSLSINYSTSAAGSMKIGLEDQEGKPIEGYRLEDCPEIFGDEIDRQVTWGKNSSVEQFSGKPIRLRFQMKDADIFSFCFTE